MSDTRVIIRVLRLDSDPVAAHMGKAPWRVQERLPLLFDFAAPSAHVCGKNDEPDVFPSEEDARQRMEEDFVPRIREIIRLSRATGKSVNIGHASSLLGKDFGDTTLGGYEIVPFLQYLTEKDETVKFHEQVQAEKVAAADGEVAVAQQKADALRAEFKLKPSSVPASTPGSGEWVAVEGVAKVQRYERRDGSVSFRGRDAGGVSPGFDTIEEAQRWLAGDRALKVSPERAAQLDALASKVMADTR